MKTKYQGIIVPDFMVFLKCIENEGKCALDIQRETTISYKHLHELKHTFIKMGWITLIPERTRQNIFLTDKGRDLVGIINKMFFTMSITYDDMLAFIKESKLKPKEEVDVAQLVRDVENKS